MSYKLSIKNESIPSALNDIGSIKNSEGIHPLQKQMHARINRKGQTYPTTLTVISGHVGVGKSNIIQYLKMKGKRAVKYNGSFEMDPHQLRRHAKAFLQSITKLPVTIVVEDMVGRPKIKKHLWPKYHSKRLKKWALKRM